MKGYVNGWVYPFMYQEHMDDPRAEHTSLLTDADLEQHLPLSAKKVGVRTIDEWTELLRRDALAVQTTPATKLYFSRPSRLLRRVKQRARSLLTKQKGF